VTKNCIWSAVFVVRETSVPQKRQMRRAGDMMKRLSGLFVPIAVRRLMQEGVN